MIIELFGAYRNVNCDGRYLEWYRSGHNEHDWKSCGRVERPEGSNPSHSAKMEAPDNLIIGCFCLYIFRFYQPNTELHIKNVLFSGLYQHGKA